eukprot:2178749-Pleurochrysis_carterae.AAC.6
MACFATKAALHLAEKARTWKQLRNLCRTDSPARLAGNEDSASAIARLLSKARAARKLGAAPGSASYGRCGFSPVAS